MFRYIYLLCVLASLSGFCQPIEAALPNIAKQEFLDTLKYCDAMIADICIKYNIDETFSKPVEIPSFTGGGLINNEQLTYTRRNFEIEWRKKDDKYFYNISAIRQGGTSPDKPPFELTNGFNGEFCKERFPANNTASIYNTPAKHAWPVPIDFGFTLGERNKTIGVALSECEIKELTTSQWDGHECYYVEAVKPNGANVRVWIDPDVGWRARHIEVDRITGGINFEASAELKEYSRGIWFPVSGIFKSYKSDDSGNRVVFKEKRLKVQSAKFNSNLTAKDFDVEFPWGTRVHDRIYDISYNVGEGFLDVVEESVLDDITAAVQENQGSLSADNPQESILPTNSIQSPVIKTMADESKTPISPKPKSVRGNSLLLWIFAIVIVALLLFSVVALVRKRGKKTCSRPY